MRGFLAVLFWLLAAGAASAQIVGTYPYTFVNGATADATQVNADFTYVQGQVNANAASAGANSNITAILGLTTPLSAAQGGSQIYTAGTSSGTANAQVVTTLVPIGFTLTSGRLVAFTPIATNTTAMTLQVNGTAVTNVYKQTPSGPVALSGGEVVAGTVALVEFDGTQFELLNSVLPETGVFTHVTAAATVDLGAIPSHSIVIDGTTTISSFGSSANVNYPIYNILFTNNLTLSYNATSLVLPGGTNVLTNGGDFMTIVYIGSGNWRVSSYTKLVNPTTPATLPGVSNFKAVNDGTLPNSKMNLSWNQAVLTNSNGGGKYASAGSVSVNLAVSGLDGLDTGVVAASTWYNLYLIASDGSTIHSLASLSSTSPTLPAGYLYYARVGAVQTDGSSNLYRYQLLGSQASYVITPATNTASFPFTTASGGSVWSSWTVSANAACAPPTASSVSISFGVTNGLTGTEAVAPNANYSGGGATTNPQACQYLMGVGGTGGIMMPCVTQLQSTAVYTWSSAASPLFYCTAWTDKVNAN